MGNWKEVLLFKACLTIYAMNKNIGSKNLIVSKAVARIMQPLVRMLINLGIGFRDFSEIAKRIYREESVGTLKEASKEVTTSALSVVSGIHRKDTSQFLKDPNPSAEPSDLSTGTSPAMALVSEWISNPGYLNEDKKPCPLMYSAKDVDQKTFTTLSSKVTKDIRAKTILEELLRLDLVHFDDKVVRLKQEAFIPQTDFDEKLGFFAKNISEHMQAATTNVQSQHPPYFERSAYHDGLNEEDIKQIDAFVRNQGMNLLKDAYRMASEFADKNKQKTKHETGHITLGIFLNYGKLDKDTEK